MKKIGLILLIVTLFCVLASCGGGSSTDTNTDTQNEHTHSFGEWQTISVAGCTSNGTMARYCECGQGEEQNIDPIGHTEEAL